MLTAELKTVLDAAEAWLEMTEGDDFDPEFEIRREEIAEAVESVRDDCETRAVTTSKGIVTTDFIELCRTSPGEHLLCTCVNDNVAHRIKAILEERGLTSRTKSVKGLGINVYAMFS